MSAIRQRALMSAVAGVLVLSGCSSSRSGGDSLLLQKPAPSVHLTTRTVTGLGSILVDGQGHALYMFPPDAGSRVSCVGPCAGVWPPLAVTSSGHVTESGGINASNVSTLKDPNTGARIVTYAGYPLYRYSGDVAAGTANGQALFNNGGPWYVLHADGQPVTVDGSGT